VKLINIYVSSVLNVRSINFVDSGPVGLNIWGSLPAGNIRYSQRELKRNIRKVVFVIIVLGVGWLM
jgi:hypothetical protein